MGGRGGGEAGVPGRLGGGPATGAGGVEESERLRFFLGKGVRNGDACGLCSLTLEKGRPRRLYRRHAHARPTPHPRVYAVRVHRPHRLPPPSKGKGRVQRAGQHALGGRRPWGVPPRASADANAGKRARAAGLGLPAPLCTLACAGRPPSLCAGHHSAQRRCGRVCCRGRSRAGEVAVPSKDAIRKPKPVGRGQFSNLRTRRTPATGKR